MLSRVFRVDVLMVLVPPTNLCCVQRSGQSALTHSDRPHGCAACAAESSSPAQGAASLLGKVLLGEAAALEEDSESRSEGSSPAFAGSSWGDGVTWGPLPPAPALLPVPPPSLLGGSGGAFRPFMGSLWNVCVSLHPTPVSLGVGSFTTRSIFRAPVSEEGGG